MFRRLNSAAPADLLERLAHPSSTEAVRQAFAEALQDDTVQMLYRLPDSDDYIDGEGTLVPTPAPIPAPGRLTVPVRDADGTIVALVQADEVPRGQRDLVEATIAASGLAIENTRLHAVLRHQLTRVRASRARVVEASLDERRRIERDLHDGAQQHLLTLAAWLGLARAQAEAQPTVDAVDKARELLQDTLRELRRLARGIHPTILAQEGLEAALDSAAQALPMPVDVDAPEARFDLTAETVTYLTAWDTLTYLARAGATGSAAVRIRSDGADLWLHVNFEDLTDRDHARAVTLKVIEDRLHAFDGELRLDEPDDRGFQLTARIPCTPIAWDDDRPEHRLSKPYIVTDSPSSQCAPEATTVTEATTGRPSARTTYEGAAVADEPTEREQANGNDVTVAANTGFVVRSATTLRRPARGRALKVLLTVVAAAAAQTVMSLRAEESAGKVLHVVEGALFVGIAVTFLFIVRRRVLTRKVASVPTDRLPDVVLPTLRDLPADPTLEVLNWIPHAGGYVDTEGVPSPVPTNHRRLVAKIRADDGKPPAPTVADSAPQRRPRLSEPAARATALSLANARVQAEIRVQTASLRRSQERLPAVVAAERRRVEDEIDNGARRQLRLLADHLDAFLDTTRADTDERATGAVRTVREQLPAVQHELHELARGFAPSVLDDQGLRAAVAAMAGTIPVTLHHDLPRRRFGLGTEKAAYFMISEGITNAVKHSGATHVRVRAQVHGERLLVQISDDGTGAADATGHGLAGIAERIRTSGGDFTVHSPLGGGTRLTADLPL